MTELKKLIDAYTQDLREEREILIVLQTLNERHRVISKRMEETRDKIRECVTDWTPGVKNIG